MLKAQIRKGKTNKFKVLVSNIDGTSYSFTRATDLTCTIKKADSGQSASVTITASGNTLTFSQTASQQYGEGYYSIHISWKIDSNTYFLDYDKLFCLVDSTEEEYGLTLDSSSNYQLSGVITQCLNGEDGHDVSIQYSADGTSWHTTPQDNDDYLRFSTDGGTTWGDSAKFNNATAIVALQTALSSETTNRTNADTALSNTISSHTSNTSNPHSVTKAQLNLGNVDNTSDANKPISTATQTALDNKVDKVTGKGLSTNDFTNEEKAKLNDIENGAEVNIIESVKVDGTALEVTNKAVNIDLSGKVDKVTGKQLTTNDFTNEEKAKADGAVRFDTTQSLTDAQKQQARENIGADEVKWGNVTGTLSQQTDLKSALDDKADDTTFTGATSLVAGSKGLVPQPSAGDNLKFLRGDGTWQSVEWNNYYGIEFDTSISSPTCTRIGNTDLHKSLPIQSLMRGCILNDDGEVVKYLNSTDWTSETRDGSLGQVMVEIPRFYIKFETDGTKRRVKLSEYPLTGYHEVPLRYVSAYQATLDRTNNKLASVVNTTAQYRGCNNQSEWDGTYRSALGKPATDISLTNYRTYARARKSGSTAWNCMTYGTQKALYWLFVVEYATLNSQASYNAELTSEGYKQGGLGNGVSNANSTWNTFNGQYPFINCGVTDSLGNETGEVLVTVKNEDDTTFVTTSVNRYRGVEIPFGHIWQCIDGALVEIGADSDTGLSRVYTCKNPANFADTITSNYSYVGNEARSGGYGKTHIFGENGEIIPAEVGGGSTSYLCDYHYTTIPSSSVATRSVRFGGNAADNGGVGFVSAHSSNIYSYLGTNVGSRLCYLPTTD